MVFTLYPRGGLTTGYLPREHRFPELQSLVFPERAKMEYRNRIPEPGTTISGFADSLKKKNNNADRPTLDFFDM
jgi:hypothetical protein